VAVDAGVQDGVDDHAQLHLQLLHVDRSRIPVAGVGLLGHDPLGVHRPALDERP
jgi:hypothetical protein